MILVTGAAGTLGGALCRELTRRNETVIGLDVNEIDLYRLSQEIPITPIVDSITRPELWDYLQNEYDIKTVYNCAAIKHVATVEQHSQWAELVNAYSIWYMADQVRPWKLVHISTDKAVKPSNKYGVSKLRGEVDALDLSAIVIRLVNIHGSRGCAEEFFAKQIAAGGPVTARDPRMERFYTTLDQAVSDILEIAQHGTPGLYLPDPGEPVMIDDLIAQMIEDRTPNLLTHGNPKIEVVYTGRQKGEKFCEDILNDDEQLEETWSKRIHRVVSKP